MLPGFIFLIADSFPENTTLIWTSGPTECAEREIPAAAAHKATDEWINEKDSPSGAAEEHNSLWPCHGGAHLQTCTEEEKWQQCQAIIFFHFKLRDVYASLAVAASGILIVYVNRK